MSSEAMEEVPEQGIGAGTADSADGLNLGDRSSSSATGEAPTSVGSATGAAPTRRQKLWEASQARAVPLRAILVIDAVVVTTYVTARLVVKLREVILLVVVASFVALLLDPAVVFVERRGTGRAVAAGLVFVTGMVAFGGLAFLFGYPLVRAVTHFADELPGIVSQATHGKGRIGHLIERYHIQRWVSQNAPKLATAAKSLSKPALSFGRATLSAVVDLATIAMLSLLIMLEAPKLRKAALGFVSESHADWLTRVASEVSRSVTGYMLGNLLTSLIAGSVIFVDLLVLGVPFALLLGLWVALVDLLPMVGGLLAGVVVVVIAGFHSVAAGVVTLAVFLVYQQIENHALSPLVMSRTVRINPLLVLLAVLVGANIGDLAGSLFGALVGALLAIPAAGAMQVVAREVWRATGPLADDGRTAPRI
ncbi:MAG: AI-2E family transporter [Acidimicrobiales bacterium]